MQPGTRAGFSWWEACGPVAYLGFQKGGQFLPSFPFPFLGPFLNPALPGTRLTEKPGNPLLFKPETQVVCGQKLWFTG